MELRVQCSNGLHAETLPLPTLRWVRSADDPRTVPLKQVIPEDGDPSPETIFRDLQMLVGAGGLERTETQFRTLCARSGLRLTRIVLTPAGLSVVEAVPA